MGYSIIGIMCPNLDEQNIFKWFKNKTSMPLNTTLSNTYEWFENNPKLAPIETSSIENMKIVVNSTSLYMWSFGVKDEVDIVLIL